MRRYIDADLLLAQCRRNPLFERTEKDKGMIYIERSIIDDTPTADVVEVRHGHWINKGTVAGAKTHILVKCSECDFGTYLRKYLNMPNGKDEYEEFVENVHYCQSCGAKMDGERKDDGLPKGI